MKIVKYIGIILVTISAITFATSFFVSEYKVTKYTLEEVINYKDHYEVIKPVISNIIDKEYSYASTLIADYQNTIDRLNNAYKANNEWDKVIWTDYTLDLISRSETGILKDKKALFIILTFGFLVLGSFLLIIANNLKTNPSNRNTNIFKSSLSNRGIIGITIGILLIGFYIIIYFYPYYLAPWINLCNPISEFIGNNPFAGQWFFYGLIYSIGIALMGFRMILLYRNNNYQILRTYSLIFFQSVFAFLLPEILASLNTPWYDFKNIWPLDYDFFYAWNLSSLTSSGGFGLFILIWGIILTIIAVPLFTYFFGKRWYCSWVCGCGGLAETVGDPFRHLSDKSIKSWKIERYIINSVLVFVTITTVITLINYFSNFELLGEQTASLHKWYGFLIGSVFAGVIGTGFYPFMGSRVWCRFGCPLAAYLGFVQRFKSRFRITVNGGQCISCGNCSVYCEMGIDVRSYAQRGKNIVRASCVGCGICAEVCPRGVLRLENKSEKNRINEARNLNDITNA